MIAIYYRLNGQVYSWCEPHQYGLALRTNMMVEFLMTVWGVRRPAFEPLFSLWVPR